MDNADAWIDHLDLTAHPEGGYYRETYRTSEWIPSDALPERFDGQRDVAALIYFLLPADAMSALHRIQQDEVWHFYAGDPLTLHRITPSGSYTSSTLGHNIEEGQHLHTVVPAGDWFGATVQGDDGYSLVGCTTAPAFDFADFELAERAVLIDAFPQHASLIRRLTRAQ